VLEISRFFGIVVAMFYNDHPPPHFHVRYGSQRASVDSSTLAVLEGCRRARLAWWWSGRLSIRMSFARRHAALRPIRPLE